MRGAKPHILLINQYFPPDTSATANKASSLATALASRFTVTVLAGRPSYDPTEFHPYYLWRRRRQGGVSIERVGSTAYHRARNLRSRAANYLSYLALAVPRALAHDADVILAMTDPPVMGIAAAIVATLRRRTLVYNIRDLYPDMALAGGLLRPGPWAAWWERWHTWALRRATRIIVLGEDMRGRVAAKGVDASRIVVVSDFAPISDSVVPPTDPVARQLRGPFPFVVMHAGNLGFYGAWATLVEAARTLQTDGVGLVFVGDGAQKDRVQAMASGLANVRILPFRPPAEVPAVLAAGDLHVITIRRGLEGVVVPSKLYTLLAAGRPILAVAGATTDVARLVTAHECGIVVDPDDARAVADAIRALKEDPARLETMAKNARVLAQDFTPDKQMAAFVRAIEEVLPSRGVARLPSSVLKRPFDVSLAGLGLVASAPLWLVVAAAIKLEDGGPVFYRQERWGLRRRRFMVYKFRTMTPEASAMPISTQASEHDPRITRFGRWLRATALDELPQLLNIFTGDMSFVGPRALPINERPLHEAAARDTDIDGFEARLAVRPGLTGIAQIFADRDVPRRHKFKYDLLYVHRQSFALDLRLIALSFWITFRGRWERRGKKY